MNLIAPLAALACFALPAAAYAASTVYGAGPSKQCYDAAEAGRTDTQALSACDEALRDPFQLDQRTHAATLVNRSVIRLKRREGREALADLDRAIALRPTLGEAHVNRGAALILNGDFAGAVASIDRGLALNPEDPHEAYFNRAIAHEKLDNYPAAYADYRQAQTLAPDWPLPARELARFSVTSR